MKRFILITTTLLLLAVVALRAYFSLVPPPEPTLTQPLSKIMPSKLSGWQIEDHDMAESEEASSRISDFLNFDDAIFRTYKNGDTQIGLYIAYWTPGKASYRWAGAHTPDTCWVQNGWSRSERKYSVPFKYENEAFEPAEFGVYHKKSTVQKVYFWHLVGGEAYSYKQQGGHNLFSSLIDIKNHGLNLRKEQFFVRLSSNKDLAELKNNAAYSEILTALLKLGMDNKSTSTTL
jgi:hypothetical protein